MDNSKPAFRIRNRDAFLYSFSGGISRPENLTAELQPCVEAFAANINRTSAISTIVCQVGGFSAHIQAYKLIEHLQSKSVSLPKEFDLTALRKSIEELTDAYGMMVGGAQLSSWAEGMHPNVFKPGYQALMAAQLVSGWTAFEVLAGDLWEIALNLRPLQGFIALGAEPSEEDDERARDVKRKKKYSLPLHQLREWNYDLKGRMGTLLRGKWDFARRSESLDAYKKAFGNDAAAMLEPLEDVNLKWLTALRNVIVHRAGIADSDFLALVQHHPDLSKLRRGDKIVFTGGLTTDLIKSVCDRGIELITAVDAWLGQHPE